MKKYFEKVVICMLIFSVCLAPVSFAIDEKAAQGIFDGATGLREDTITADEDGASLRQSSSAIILTGADTETGTITSGNFVLNPDGTITDNTVADSPVTLSNMRLVDSDGNVEYDISYNESTGEFCIRLEDEYFSKDGSDYNLSFVYNDGEKDVVIANMEGTSTYSELSEGEPGRITLKGLFTDTVNTVVRALEKIVNDVFIPLGDGILYFVFRCVGEVVTIDGLIFNEVDKVSIDYFNSSSAPGSLKAIMSSTVNKFYGLFFKIAVLVYMITLVITGIQVMLQSTADKKAKYKEFMVSWVVGVAILCLFPYVMKYTIKLNDAFVKSIKTYMSEDLTAMSDSERQARNEKIKNTPESSAWVTFGEDEFIEIMMGEEAYAAVTAEGSINLLKINDAMIQTRVLAKKLNRFALTIVYFILIGQTIVILIQYYKRAFMIAFLITIFPLVAMTYAIDKVGDKKAQSFGIWFKEFVVNVIVQMFHATVYALMIRAGMKTYVQTGGQNWLFLILCILFLFQGEKILRNIFNVKSSANTIGDLAATGAMAYGVLKQIGGLKPGASSIAGKDDQKDAADAEKRQETRNAQRTITASNTNPTTEDAGDPTQRSTDTGPSNYGQYTENDPAGVDTAGYDGAAAKDTVLADAMKRRLKRGMASGAVNLGGRAVGVVMGATYGMSKGDTGAGIAGNAITGGVAGKTIGEGMVRPLDAGVNKLEQIHQGNKVANKIENGEMDGALGLAGMPPPDVDPDQIIGKNGESMQEIYRQALAEMARATARKGKAKGELAYWSYIDKHTKK